MPPQQNSFVSNGARRCRPLIGTVALLLSIAGSTLCSHAAESNSIAPRILTNIYDIWELPRAERAEPHRMRTELTIYIFDSEWNNAWGECNGRPTWLPIADAPFPLHAGQRVAIDGVIIPLSQRFTWDQTQIRVLEEDVDLKATAVHNLNDNPIDLKGRLVQVEGLIDTQLEDPTHVSINFLSGDARAVAYVLKETNAAPIRFHEGDLIRIKCVYSPQFDRNGNLGELSLYVARTTDVEVIGSLKTDPRFAVPLISTQEIQEDTPTNNLLHVAGVVRNHEPGKWVTLWDDTGQVMVQSRQTQPLRPGDPIEAIGYPYIVGVGQCLHAGLYRSIPPDRQTSRGFASPPGSVLRIAERVRDLSREDAERHPPVDFRAIVTWSHPQSPFAYVEDASGGIRIANPKWEGTDASKPGSIVMVRGEAAEGDFVPVVTNAVVSRIGWWNLDEARLVTLEQALTGVEDGNWVEMRGFVRKVNPSRGLTQLELSTSSGEFQLWAPATQSFDYLQGSVIRVRGVCVAVSNPRHQLTGIQIWAPDVKYLQVEERAPDDLFAAPLRSMDGLRRFNLQNTLNQRVRTAGTVVLHAPGRYVYAQDGADSIFALAQQQEVLRPGDRIEIVGFPGNEGRRFLLREAAYRRISTGGEPTPLLLSAVHSVNLDWEGLLAKADGTLLNAVEKDGKARLIVRTKDSAFEVSLDLNGVDATKKLRDLELGSRVSVTGVYEVQSDEYGKPRSFLLHLRSWNDVQVLQQSPWWTFARLLWVLLGVLGVFLIALIWGILISRKNAALWQAQAELKAANDKLELRVEERTQELREQVAAKERAHDELARVQEDLMLISRRAGMAEVATGVLHNVGNVLNSVNVSAALLSERLRYCRVESVAKTAELLNKQRAQLGRFLSEDPRGKALPGYIQELADSLLQDKRDMQGEIETLAKNIEHIKIIVGMQQSYAKVAGVLEQLDPRDLAEDAIQINSAAFDRHHIQLVRDYQPVPRVMVDRHKVLQILVNLLNNAKHALNQTDAERTVYFGIRRAGPNQVHLVVQDNGMGIAPENLNRIFSQGFTTRKDGHGFGLHSGANSAKELGGSLTAHSEGPNRGATFVLELPVPDPAPGATPTQAHP
jgi:two-component system, cell cycle sensor histidine kinase and response regulator CckA